MNCLNYRTSDMQRFLLERYVFRNNIVSGKTEYLYKDNEKSGFRKLIDYEINPISLVMKRVYNNLTSYYHGK